MPTPFSFKLAPAALLLAGFFCSTAHADTTIVIVRHAEKPALGLGQINCKGLNRALALPSVLLKQYGKPNFIYAPNPSVEKIDSGVSYTYFRPLATIEPTAIRLGMTINIHYGETHVEPLAKQILASSGTQYVAWEHRWGEALSKELLTQLGVKTDVVPKWQDDDFDSIYVIRVKGEDPATRTVTFSHEQEGLNGMPEACTDGPGRG